MHEQRSTIHQRARYAKLVLAAAVAAMVVSAGTIATIGYVRSNEIVGETANITNDAAESIRLVDRMGIEVLRQRSLVDQHIYESEPAGFRTIDQRIAASRAAFDTAAAAYVPLATYPGEPAAWQRLSRDVAALTPLIDDVLARSRADHDRDAHAALVALEPRFDVVDADVASLIAINQNEAQGALVHVGELAHGGVVERLLFALVSVVLTLAIGAYAARLIARALTLEGRNQELDAFTGRVAHDLRNPLSVISMSAAALVEQQGDSRNGDRLLRGISRMDRLITDLLELSRAGGDARGETAPMTELAGALERELRPLVDEASGSLHVDCEAAEVCGREGLLHAVLWNLGENAVKYRRLDVAVAVEVTGRVRGDRYVVQVADNGSGMSAEEQQHAFDPLFRGEHARPTPGTGLGLSIVKRVIEASGGTVRVTSRPGATTFEVELRIARARARAALAAS